MGKNEKERIDEDVVEAIKNSAKKRGQLYPILVDANDIIIDGEHRNRAIKDPNIVKLPQVKSKKDRLEVRLIANHARKGQDRSSWVPTLTELAKEFQKEGILEKIGMKISEETGVPYRTLMRYLPDEFKDQAQSSRASHPRSEEKKSDSLALPQESEEELSTEERKSSAERVTESKSLPVTEVLKEYEDIKDKPKPHIEVKEFKNQRWKAIIVPEDFYEKLKEVCERNHIDLQEAVTLALVKLLEDLRRKRDA